VYPEHELLAEERIRQHQAAERRVSQLAKHLLRLVREGRLPLGLAQNHLSHFAIKRGPLKPSKVVKTQPNEVLAETGVGSCYDCNSFPACLTEHHLYWPEHDYTGDPVSRTFHDLPVNKMLVCRKMHDDFHETEEPPPKPSREDMLQAIAECPISSAEDLVMHLPNMVYSLPDAAA